MLVCVFLIIKSTNWLVQKTTFKYRLEMYLGSILQTFKGNIMQATGNKQKRVLLVMSSVDEMGISGKHTGTWFTELAAPYYILTEAGHEVVLASPNGGEAPIDLLSHKAPLPPSTRSAS